MARHSAGRVACHTMGSRTGPHVANAEEGDHTNSRSSVATVGFSCRETEVHTLKTEADTDNDGKEVAALCFRERRLGDRYGFLGTTCRYAFECGLVVRVYGDFNTPSAKRSQSKSQNGTSRARSHPDFFVRPECRCHKHGNNPGLHLFTIQL